jgi:CheY-like chemotaxis protein
VGEGSGLGLSQVYGLVQQSGGATKIDSEPGKGTTVSIYLPAGERDTYSDPGTPRAVPALRADARHVGCRIVLVDDDEEVRNTLSAMLDEAGYVVVSFRSPLQALEELRSRRPAHLVIVDFAMPELRGDEFAAQARRLRGGIPVVFVTGYAAPAGIRSERWVLEKPFGTSSLLDIIEQAISDAEALTSRV